MSRTLAGGLLHVRGPRRIPGVVFWTLLTLAASSFPVKTPRGPVVNVSIAPILAAAILGGPATAAIVAFVGTFDTRELRRQVPWYGTLYDHCSAALPAALAGALFAAAVGPGTPPRTVETLLALLAAGASYFVVGEVLAAAAVALRHGRSLRPVIAADLRAYGLAQLGLAPLAWAIALAYLTIGPLVAVLLALPMYTTRASFRSVVEVREMFTQTVLALASAIDARDPWTRLHSQRVATIALEIGRELKLGEAALEQLEWGGLLHDIGKIGVRDAVLLKSGRLDREERMAMNAHPWMGYEILLGVDKLKPEIQIILHHHQWYNGSGYTGQRWTDPVTGRDRPVPGLIGEEIPYLARILHVADAFEAMTAVRPYRTRPLTPDQALEELYKFSGIQFDPRVVDAFSRTRAARGGHNVQEPVVVEPSIPMLGQVAARRAREALSTSVPLPADRH